MASVESLANQVQTNLIHYNFWTKVKIHDINNGLKAVIGLPPSKLDSNDEEDQPEWVIPRSLVSNSSISVKEINEWFTGIAILEEKRPKRITIGIVNDDGTVVYYFIHDGIVKPRQN
ncbi:tRNA-splicing endonuclease subunit Sen15 [Scheffersomyces xylosifermentans]|uniref:tRNA-splicing endonuclease subunit Sen15 n=1 Tax=Scheffersomyces xylosifermentans TaxID=1304137 RepID=UPI00315C966C